VRLTRPKAPLTYKQKEDICKKIAELDDKSLPGLLEILHPDTKDGDIEINIDELDDPTLLNIQKYINKCKKAASVKTARK